MFSLKSAHGGMVVINVFVFLQEFVENSRKAMKEGSGAESRELKPMVGASEEMTILQEFHFYFLSLSVFTDWASSGDFFVVCVTEDVLLFLLFGLPISWLAESLSQLRPSSVKAS